MTSTSPATVTSAQIKRKKCTARSNGVFRLVAANHNTRPKMGGELDQTIQFRFRRSRWQNFMQQSINRDFARQKQCFDKLLMFSQTFMEIGAVQERHAGRDFLFSLFEEMLISRYFQPLSVLSRKCELG